MTDLPRQPRPPAVASTGVLPKDGHAEAPRLPYDPDPLDVTAATIYAAGYDDGAKAVRSGRDGRARARRERARLALAVSASAVLLLTGIAIGRVSARSAAPRPSPQTTERVDMSAPASAEGWTGAPPEARRTFSCAMSPCSSGAPSLAASRKPATPGVASTPAPTERPTEQPARSSPVSVRSRSGVASYCAPTPRYCHGWAPPALLGAVASFRWGDRPYRVRVCRRSGSPCVTVRVVSFCACGNHLIDLSPAAFTRLAPLSRGVVRVRVTGLR